MFQPDQYIASLIAHLQAAFGERLVYVGLQGSYLRGEAGEHSDIDIMAVIDQMTVSDLRAYREAVECLPDADKSCGFICGRDELLHWNPLEICHLKHTTKDYYGVLSDLLPLYTEGDVAAFVKLSIGNLYHEICHRFIHASREKNEEALGCTYKGVFFILQNLHYLESGRFISTKQELLAALTGQDRQVLEMALAFSGGQHPLFDQAFELLFSWCRAALMRASGWFGTAP